MRSTCIYFFIKKYLSIRKIKYKVNLSWKVIEMILNINILMMDMMRIKQKNLSKFELEVLTGEQVPNKQY